MPWAPSLPLEVADVRLVSLVLVLAVTALALGAVAVAYVVWIRIVGLDPTLARRAAALPGTVTIPAAVVLGVGLGTSFALLPTLRSGLWAVIMLTSSSFAGLLLFELYAERVGHDA